MKLHAALMTQNELLDLVTNITGILPHVDSVTIVDGGSTDGTIPHFRNWSRQEPKIRFFIHPWTDNFPAQRNNYLAHVSEIAQNGDWLTAFDPDEFLDPEILPQLRSLGETAAHKGFSKIGFRCRSVSLRGPDRVWSNEDGYWKQLMVQWHKNLRYAHNGEGAVHEYLQGAGTQVWNLDAPGFYEHRKQENVIWWRGVRNYFCGGGGPNLGTKNHRWVELRQVTNGLGITSWHQMLPYLVKGNIDQGLRAWIIKYHEENGWDGSSEQREWYKLYFRMLHPEEEPAELRGKSIP